MIRFPTDIGGLFFKYTSFTLPHSTVSLFNMLHQLHLVCSCYLYEDLKKKLKMPKADNAFISYAQKQGR